jgi:hypothetical protein
MLQISLTSITWQGSLSTTAKRILSLGLRFIPTPPRACCTSARDIECAIKDLSWRIHWKHLFRNKLDDRCPAFYVRNVQASNAWNPVYPSTRIRLGIQSFKRCLLAKWNCAYRGYHEQPRSLPRPAMTTIVALRQATHTIIRPADKNMGLCIVKRDWYVDACLSHLHLSRGFVLIPQDEVAFAVQFTAFRLSRLIQRLDYWIRHPSINVSRTRLKEHLKYLKDTQGLAHRVPAFYGLVKAQMEPVSLRPIVACHSRITTPLSRVCAYELHQLIQAHMHHVLRDSTHLIKLVEESPFAVRAPASSIRLITRDVEGLRSPLDITALALYRSLCNEVKRAW